MNKLLNSLGTGATAGLVTLRFLIAGSQYVQPENHVEFDIGWIRSKPKVAYAVLWETKISSGEPFTLNRNLSAVHYRCRMFIHSSLNSKWVTTANGLGFGVLIKTL